MCPTPKWLESVRFAAFVSRAAIFKPLLSTSAPIIPIHEKNRPAIRDRGPVFLYEAKALRLATY
jgi:hypothetical protein